MEVLSAVNVDYKNTEDFEYEYPESEEVALIEALTTRLEQELRMAKKEHLSVGEVLLPNGLTRRISREMFLMGDSEPCGLRGCTLYINFEGDAVKRTISKIKCDPTVPTTFELYLTLKQSTAGWNSFLPQFLKKITRSGTVMISPEYSLHKNKLYRSSLSE